jgi:hypothetical protein
VIIVITLFALKIRQYEYVKEILQLKSDIYEDVLAHLNNAKAAQDNSDLVEIIKKYFLHQPSTLPYNLTHPNNENPSPGQTQFVDEYLQQKVGISG